MHMEKLFYDTFVEERDRVWLATHHLVGEAYLWWLDIRDNPNTDLSAISWKRLKELLLAHCFPDSVKRQMEKDLRGLRQGSGRWSSMSGSSPGSTIACLSSCGTMRTRPTFLEWISAVDLPLRAIVESADLPGSGELRSHCGERRGGCAGTKRWLRQGYG
uniref:Retrotransposon gag domain-containing protein n=1 Tax=Ananas comosus var. bracteatus TaxID=296719 RepID=A0A6V7NHH3_ANACO|nr:unnamed protein product [Ananas comosus var. bracteatus]